MTVDRRIPAEPGDLAAEVAELRRRLAKAEERANDPGENRFRLIVDSAVDYGIIALDLDGLVTEWNAGAHRILGWSEAEMLGRPASVFFTEDDRRAGVPQAEMQGALRDGRGSDERWHLRKDGSRFWASGEMMPLKDGAGVVQGFVKFLRDRSKQQREAEKTRADAEFLRSVLASSADCIKVLDLDGNLEFMSEGGQQVMEVSDFNAIRGCPWPDLLGEAGGQQARDAVATARKGDVAHFQCAAATMAGHLRHWDVQVTPIFGADGKPRKLLSVSRDLTATRQTEEALRASERRLRGLVAASADIVYSLTPDWGVLRQLSGKGFLVDTESADPDWLAEYIHPDDQRQVLDAIAAAVSGKTPYDLEHQVRTKDGSLGWVHSRAVPVLAEDGSIEEWFGTAVDITARRMAERCRGALLELADRLRDLHERSAIVEVASGILGRTLGLARAGFGVVDPVADVVNVERDWRLDPAMASIAGPHDFRRYGSYVDDLHRGEIVAIPDLMRDRRTETGVAQFEALGVRSFLNVPLMDGGQLAAIVLVLSNETHEWTEQEIGFARGVADRTWAALQQARAEAELHRVNETLEHEVAERTADRNRLWQMSQDLMLVAGTDGRIDAVNPAWRAVLGWREDELVGSSLFSLIHPEDLDRTVEGAKAIGEGATLTRFENRYRRADGSYAPIAWTAGPSEGLIVAVGRDMTAEQEQAEALRASEEQLRQAQKMEAVGQLTGGLAHDFNNLLTGITGSLELMNTRIGQGRLNDLQRYMVAAQGAAKRAAALTHRLLAFSRQQTLAPKATNVNTLVSGMLELLQRTVGPGVQVDTVLMSGLWPALVDQPQLENALLNLCINSRDAMPEGGKITIETGNRWIDRHGARQQNIPEGQYLSLCVSDTGTGMPPDVIAKAFDPFFTTKPIGQGTGLGLSMIYGFARQSGGQVRIYSEVGEGTMVCIYLPRHRGVADEAEVLPETAGRPVAEAGETVLVVDDEPTVRMLVADVLGDLGYTAIEAADGAGGLNVLQSDARVDLLITDVGLPGGMNGRQVADAARVARPDLKVLFITGFAENALLNNGQLEPGMSVLTKPFAVDTLAARIHELITA